MSEARADTRAGLALLPSFTIRRYRDSAACDHPAYLAGRQRAYEEVRLAGVPKGSRITLADPFARRSATAQNGRSVLGVERTRNR